MTYPPVLAFMQVVLDWWDALSFTKSIFYGIGVVAGFVALVLALLSFIGFEHHDAFDAGDASDAGGGIFSVKPLTGFFLGFGWTGGLAMDAGFSGFVALVSGSVAGAVIMAVIVLMFRMIMAMRSDGTVRIAESVGAVGTVYVTLPAARASGGQVTVNFSGRQETYAALQAGEKPIASGEKIRVREVLDNHTLLVEPL